MQRLTAVEYDELVRDARMLSADEHGPKVLLRTDDMVIKVFRRKRWLSSAFIRGDDYGTRASTVVALDRDGGGVIVEARWGPMGVPLGQSRLELR